MNLLMEPIETKKTVVKCNGGAGLFGHPVIYLNLGKEKKVTCPYCSKVYVKKAYILREDDKKSPHPTLSPLGERDS